MKIRGELFEDKIPLHPVFVRGLAFKQLLHIAVGTLKMPGEVSPDIFYFYQSIMLGAEVPEIFCVFTMPFVSRLRFLVPDCIIIS